jgi:hypothetical protein
MKLNPIKVDLKTLILFQKEYEETFGKNFDVESHLENQIMQDYFKAGLWTMRTSKRKYKIENIFKICNN